MVKLSDQNSRNSDDFSEGEGLSPSSSARSTQAAPWAEMAPLHWVGYGLLGFVAFSIGDALIPAQLMNPAWELQAIGSVVEQAPLLLVSFVILFCVDRYRVGLWERRGLNLLSWLALLLGILYLLMVPLAIADAVRVDRQNHDAIVQQFNDKRQVIERVKAALGQVKTAAEMEQLISSLNNTGMMPTIRNSQQLTQVKQQLNQAIEQGTQSLTAQAVAAKSEQRTKLLKKSVKWNFGAILAGLLLLNVWQSTRWVRQWR